MNWAPFITYRCKHLSRKASEMSTDYCWCSLVCPMSEKGTEQAGLMKHTGVKGVWYWAKCSQEEDLRQKEQHKYSGGRIYTLPGPLIKKQASTVSSPRAKPESQGYFSKCLLIFPEDPGWASQPIVHPLVFPGCVIMRPEVSLEKAGSTPPRIRCTKATHGNHQTPTLQPRGETDCSEYRGERTGLQILPPSCTGHLTSRTCLYFYNGDNNDPVCSECCEDQVPITHIRGSLNHAWHVASTPKMLALFVVLLIFF